MKTLESEFRNLGRPPQTGVRVQRIRDLSA